MSTSVTPQLRALIVESVNDALDRQKAKIVEAVLEAIEDAALARAMDEALESPPATREEVFGALRRKR